MVEPDRKFLLRVCPGIAKRLLQSKRDASFASADRKDNRVHRVAGFENVAGLANFLQPRHLRNVDEAFDSWFQFDECSKVHETRDRAGDSLANFKFLRCGIPWLRLKLFEAKRNAAILRVDLQRP